MRIFKNQLLRFKYHWTSFYSANDMWELFCFSFWAWISQHISLSENFIRKHRVKLCWVNISFYQTLSEDFIRELQIHVVWYLISRKQKLSENFMREFKKEIDWQFISHHQEVSDDFLMEMVEYLDLDHLEREIKNRPIYEKLQIAKQLETMV